MASKIYSDSIFTIQVKALLDKIYGRSIVKDSILDRAITFYSSQNESQVENEKLNEKLSKLKGKVASLNSKEQQAAQKNIISMEQRIQTFQQQLSNDKEGRQQHLQSVSLEIIELCEADSFSECNRKSAQMLGTLQLLSPTEGKKVALNNEITKPLYKAILCLRLLDRLCLDSTIAEPYISQYLQGITPENYQEFAEVDPEQYQLFISQVKMPLVMAALLQDIGHYHPDAQKIVKGASGELDPYRTLELDDRKALLQINYRETIRFLIEGIGKSSYVGNSRDERDIHNEFEGKKLIFIRSLLKSSISPKNGIGNILKVPQIYTSLIMSTKNTYNYKLLPKVYLVLKQNAERGGCSQSVVNALYKITGVYPQGYGITYIPKDSDGRPTDRYEYAIVNQLYPKKPDQPVCRAATKNLTFISHGQDFIVTLDSNLYLPETAKQLSRISKERLNEILELLSSNYQERKSLDLVPRCWQTQDFFEIKNNQKLWNKVAEA